TVGRRPFFSNTIRFAWRVTGAHDLAPIATHDLNRFERYSVPDAKFEARLPDLFPAFLQAARRLDLAHVSLMFQPEHNLVGVPTPRPPPGGRPGTQFGNGPAPPGRAGLGGLGVGGASDRPGCREVLCPTQPQPGRLAAVVGAGRR